MPGMKFAPLLAVLFLLPTLLLQAPLLRAETVTIAAASDLQFAMDALVRVFRQQEADANLKLVYGSSGTFNAQISQGAPFDLYFSADISYPQALLAKGLAASEVRPYATGRLVLWSLREDVSTLDWSEISDPRFRRIAIANPRHAPYGKRAEETLQALGMLDEVRGRLVLGENISQAAQFVQTGNAELGLVALSLVSAPGLSAQGWYQLVPANLHEPLLQGYIITRRAQDNALAWRFAAFVESPVARGILESHGFVLPASPAAD